MEDTSGEYPAGRPDMEQTTTSEQEKADAATSEPVKVTTRGTAIEQPPVSEDKAIGLQPENKPFRDRGNKGGYAKEANQVGIGVTPDTGIAPDVGSALASDETLSPA